MKEDKVIAALGALAQDTRLRMLRHLVTMGEAGAAAGDIAAAVGTSASGASFHLTVLTDAGLLVSTRRSRQIIYRVDFHKLGALIGYIVSDCCKNDPRVTSCC